MDKKVLPWNVRQLAGMAEKGTLTFNNPFQRPSGQWNEEDKTLLIDSIFRMFIPEIYVLQYEEDGRKKYDVIDGLQRCSILISFYNNDWALLELPPVKLDTTGEVYDISGKYFTELPEDVQDVIKNYTLTAKIIIAEEGEDPYEIAEDLTYRLNNGKPMSREHLAYVKAQKEVKEFSRRIMSSHQLFKLANYTVSSIKKSDREITVLQTIMLFSGKKFESFATKDVEKFFAHNYIEQNVLDKVEEGFDAIIEALECDAQENKFIKKFISKVNIPIMAYVLCHANNLKEAARALVEYIPNANAEDNYKKYTGAGNVKKYKVEGRIKAMAEICGVELPILEEDEENEISPETQKVINELEEVN